METDAPVGTAEPVETDAPAKAETHAQDDGEAVAAAPEAGAAAQQVRTLFVTSHFWRSAHVDRLYDI